MGNHSGLDRVGHDGFARMVRTIHGALTDYHCEIHSMVVEDNKAFCRLRFTGRHSGNLLGFEPTNDVVSWMGATEFTIRDDKIAKVWELGDMKTLEGQLLLSKKKKRRRRRRKLIIIIIIVVVVVVVVVVIIIKMRTHYIIQVSNV